MFVIQGQEVGLCQPPYWILAPCWQRIYSPDSRARRGLAASLLSVCGQDESTPGSAGQSSQRAAFLNPVVQPRQEQDIKSNLTLKSP